MFSLQGTWCNLTCNRHFSHIITHAKLSRYSQLVSVASHCYFTSVRLLACLTLASCSKWTESVLRVAVCSPCKTAGVAHSVRSSCSVIDLTCAHPMLAASFRPVYASCWPFLIPVHAERKLRVQWVVFYAGTVSWHVAMRSHARIAMPSVFHLRAASM